MISEQECAMRRLGDKGEVLMESTFGSWRSAALGLGLTIAIVGGGLALAFW